MSSLQLNPDSVSLKYEIKTERLPMIDDTELYRNSEVSLLIIWTNSPSLASERAK